MQDIHFPRSPFPPLAPCRYSTWASLLCFGSIRTFAQTFATFLTLRILSVSGDWDFTNCIFRNHPGEAACQHGPPQLNPAIRMPIAFSCTLFTSFTSFTLAPSSMDIFIRRRIMPRSSVVVCQIMRDKAAQYLGHPRLG